MERLTERLENGVIKVKYASQHETAIHRLVTIEDILGDEYDLDLLQKQIQAYREGRYIILKEPEQAGISRLRELAQADREGRCVVQEFIPGGEVWVVERDKDGEATEVSCFVFVVSVSGVAIVSPSINGYSDLDFILYDFVAETAGSFSGDFSGYPISDCYKSYEEAEAALQGEQEEKR